MDGIASLTKREEGEKEPIVMVLGATNFPWLIDEALRRRLEKRICNLSECIYSTYLMHVYVDIPLPDLDSRKQLLQLNLSGIKLDESVSLDGLAEKLDGYSGADITNVRLASGVYLM